MRLYITVLFPAIVFSWDHTTLRTLLSVRPSVFPSLSLSDLYHNVRLILSSWNFQEFLLLTKVVSMQKVKVQGHKSQNTKKSYYIGQLESRKAFV